MPANVPLWFPEGVPEGVRRITNPDAIHKRVQAGIKDLMGQKWSRMAPAADRIARGQRSWWKRLFSGTSDVDPKWLTHALYRPREYPSGITRDEQDNLALLRRLRDMGGYRTDPLEAEDLVNAPTRDQLRAALKMMAKDADALVDKMWSSYNDMLSRVGSEVEPLCEQVYGEPCSSGEGPLLVAGDVESAVKANAFRGVLSPDGQSLLWEFMRVYRNS